MELVRYHDIFCVLYTYRPVYGLNVLSMLKHQTLVLTEAAVDDLERNLVFSLNRFIYSYYHLFKTSFVLFIFLFTHMFLLSVCLNLERLNLVIRNC